MADKRTGEQADLEANTWFQYGHFPLPFGSFLIFLLNPSKNRNKTFTKENPNVDGLDRRLCSASQVNFPLMMNIRPGIPSPFQAD